MKREFVPTDSWNIIALDPSTDWTGAVLLHVPFEGTPSVLQATAISGDWSLGDTDVKETRKGTRNDIRGTVDRIDRTAFHLRAKLNEWKQDLDGPIDLVAIEDNRYMPGMPGAKTTEVLVATFYHYLAIPQFRDIPLMPIVRMSGCAASGPEASRIFREAAGKTAAEKNAKKARLKAAVQAGVLQQFPNLIVALLSPEEKEAICDAAAVGLAAGLKLVEAERLARAEALQPKLQLRKAPVRRPKVAA